MLKKNARYLNKFVVSLSYRFILSLLLIMSILLVGKFNPKFVRNFKTALFDKSLNFVNINNLSKKIIGKEVFYYQDLDDSIEVLNADVLSGGIQKYYDGEKFQVSSDLPIGIFQSGVVVFNGRKDNFNNTVIVQGVDGFNIWYGNLENINVSLYDYVETGTLIGNANGDSVYILIEKDGKNYTYAEYQEI